MEHFKPFVHLSKAYSAIGDACRKVLPHRRKKSNEDAVDQETVTRVGAVLFPWRGRTQNVEAAVLAHQVKEGVRLAMRGELRQAVAVFEQAAEEGWKHPYLYYNWGLALSHLGEHEDACEKYLTALELDIGCIDAVVNCGVSLAALERHEEAIEKYRQAAEINPKIADVFFNWGCSLVEMDRPDAACEMFEKAAQLSPRDAQIHYNWAISLAKTGHSQAAIERMASFSKLARGRFKEQAEQVRSLLEAVDKQPTL